MSELHLNHIKTKLTADFSGSIDMSDYDRKSAEDIEAARLSRSLAAFALTQRMEIAPAVAANDVVDGFDDNGVDAIGIDSERSTVIVVQSKWDRKGGGGPDVGSVEKFASGFRDLINARFERFNDKVQRKAADLTAALDNPNVKFDLVLVHSGQQELSEHADRVLTDLLAELNDVSEIAFLRVFNQAAVHDWVRRSIAGEAPDLEVTLHDWGVTQEPFQAFYGQVDAADVAEWWEAHHVQLFDKNLRKFIPDSEVNASIVQTLVKRPERFWYFNNGITVLCDRISKAPLGSTHRKSGKFLFEGATVVNGAQTVGCIGRALVDEPASVEDARVAIRFISLENCPPDFSTEVTRATNTQNRVERRDFVALDGEQERLRTELQLDEDKTYALKTGEPDPPKENGCTVVEATIALACAQPTPDLAVQAKREIGRLWEDVEKEPYTKLFNSTVSAKRLWRAVQVLREVDDVLRTEQSRLSGRDRSVAVHGNRLVAHVVFRALGDQALEADGRDFPGTLSTVANVTKHALTQMRDVVEVEYENNYLASLFKNATRCRNVVAKISLGS